MTGFAVYDGVLFVIEPLFDYPSEREPRSVQGYLLERAEVEILVLVLQLVSEYREAPVF